MSQIVLNPIGVVRNQVKEPKLRGSEWDEIASDVVIDEEWSEHLEGLEDFSHIVVIFWMHRSPAGQKPPSKIHPRGREDLPLVGLLSTRAPFHPNPLGVSTVRLLERRGNTLKVQGLDAIDGTPVIDIKPHIPPFESPDNVRMPDWVAKMRS